MRIALAIGFVVAMGTAALICCGSPQGQDAYRHTPPACPPRRETVSRAHVRGINPGLRAWTEPSEAARIFEALRDLDVGWIRGDFQWRFAEPERGRFDWERLDRLVAQARDRQIQVLALLAYSAEWANGGMDETYPPSDVEDYVRFVREVVTRYRPRGILAQQEGWSDGYGVRHWEIWNEPNYAAFWKPEPNVDDYVELLHRAAAAIRSLDEEAVILHGGLAPERPAEFLEAMYSRGARDSFDIANVHPYTFGPRPAEIRATVELVRDVMRRHGDTEKPLWITEFGYRTGPEGWVTEDEQARYVREAYELLAEGCFEGLFWFSLVDYDSGEEFGLLRGDGSARAAYRAYRDTAGSPGDGR